MSTTIKETLEFYFVANDQKMTPVVQKMDTAVKSFGERVKEFRAEKRASGETAIDKLFGGSGEHALDYLLNIGPKVAITSFAMRMLGDAAEGAAEHFKKVREGGESAAEGILKAAAAVPIFGEAVKAGMGVGNLFHAIFGHESAEEELKRAKENDDKLKERTKMMQEGRARDRMIGLHGDAKDRAEIDKSFNEKLEANASARRDARLAEQRKLKEEEDRIWSKVHFTPEGDRERDRDLKALKGGGLARVTEATKPFNDEEIRLKKEKADAVKEIEKEQGRAVIEIVRGSELAASHARREVAVHELTEQGREFLAKKTQLEGEYQDKVKDIAKRAEDARRTHNKPGDATRINLAAATEEKALAAKLASELEDAQDAAIVHRREMLRKEAQDTADIRQATAAKNLAANKQTLEAELSQLRYDAQAKRDQIDRDTAEEIKHKSYAEALRIESAASARKNAITDDERADERAARKRDRERLQGIGDQRFGIDSQLRRERIEALQEEGERGNFGATIEAKKLEIAEKYRQKREEILRILRDENASGAEKQGALGIAAGLSARQAAELKRLAGSGGSQAQGFSLESGRFLTGVQGQGASIDDTAKNTKVLPDILTVLTDGFAALARALIAGHVTPTDGD